jgi:hypothetical protein
MSRMQGPTTRSWRTLEVRKRMIPHLLVFVYYVLWMGERTAGTRHHRALALSTHSPSHDHRYDVYLVAVVQRGLQAA